MPITPAQLVQILISRNIGVRPVIIPGQPVRWRAGTYDQTHAEGRAHKGTFATPEEAVEAAEATLSAANARAVTASAERLLSGIESGEVYLRPREDVPTGTPGPLDTPGVPGRLVWDLVNSRTGEVTEVQGSSSPRAALEALADKIDRDKAAARKPERVR